MEKITVAIADDHSVVTEGIRIVLKADPRFVLNGVFSNGEELLIFLAEQFVDVVVLDIDIPGGEDFGILRKIKLMDPNCKVVIFTMHTGIKYFFEAKRFGADAFVVKTDPITFLPTVIIQVLSGAFYASPELREFLEKEQNDRPLLNPIELEIVSCIAKGMYYKEIAEKIGKSEKTVEYHTAKIRKKFEVQNNADLLLKLNK